MLQIIFKNMERSELAKDVVSDRLAAIVDKFPDLENCLITVTLDMQNSQFQAGPDLFNVTVQVKNGRYRGIRLTKSAPNLYKALADNADHLLETLNRFGDRARVKSRNQARGISLVVPSPTSDEGLENSDDWDLGASYPRVSQLGS